MTFEINSLVPELWCSDFEASMEFYAAVLGFEVAQRRENDPHAYLTLQGAQIMIAHWQLDGKWAPWLPEQMTRPFGRGINFQFLVPDVDRMYEAALARGAKLLLELYDADVWKTDCMDTRRQFMILDPDGYLLRFGQSLRTRPVNDSDLKKLTQQYSK